MELIEPIMVSYMNESFWLDHGKINLTNVKIDRKKVTELLKTKPKQVIHEIHFEREGGPKDGFHVLDAIDRRKEKISSYDKMDSFNQLGIKDYLLQKMEESSLHNRLAHSVGTALIGTLYFLALEPFIDFTIFKNVNKEEMKKLLNFALYLHDVGHLPFSHLIEEAFKELNWTRIRGKLHRHDEAPLEQLNDQEKKGIKEALEEVFGEEKKEGYFELVQDLIAGISGIPFLDAIVNSPIDADKIDYIFRDLEFTERRVRIRPEKEWLEDFLSNISLSPNGLVRLNGEASLCVLELLQERQFLYHNLYLRPDIRAFEIIAKTIVISWMVRESSRNLLDLLEKKKEGNTYILEPDLREGKGKNMAEKIIQKFYDLNRPKELNVLIAMANEIIEDTYTDDKAKKWFGVLKGWIEKFLKSGNNSRKLSKDIIVEEPFYIYKRDVEKAREIARNIYIDYPCGVLIDIAEFPRFLPYSRARRYHFYDDELVGENFLVPDREPGKWGGSKIGKFPLHLCDFTGLEEKFAQVTVINPEPDEVRGVYFYDLYIQKCRVQGMEIKETIRR